MTTLLHISASPRGPRSESLAIAATFLDELRATHPEVTVEHWDLWDGTLPEFGPPAAAAKMAVFGGADPEGDEAAAWRAAHETFQRFDSADHYLFTVPMWNASVPYILKQLIDVISQPGMIFSFDPAEGYTRTAREQAGRRHLHRCGLRPRPWPGFRQRLPAALLRGLVAAGPAWTTSAALPSVPTWPPPTPSPDAEPPTPTPPRSPGTFSRPPSTSAWRGESPPMARIVSRSAELLTRAICT